MIGEAIEKSVAQIIPVYINGTIHPLFDEETDAYRVQFAVTSSFIIGLVQVRTSVNLELLQIASNSKGILVNHSTSIPLKL